MTRPVSWPSAVLFDLDGTLIDSAPDIREALNATLADEVGAPFDLGDVRTMIGGGIALLIARALDRRGIALDAERKSELTARFVELYEPRATRLTTLVSGAREALAACRDSALSTALVTNKPEAPARAILDHFGIADRFDLVIGGDAGPEKKPAPDLLLLAAKRLRVSVDDCLFVGDSENDVIAAKAAGMAVAALKGGYTALTIEELASTYKLESLKDLPRHFTGITDL